MSELGFGKITASVDGEGHWWKAIPRYVMMVYLLLVGFLVVVDLMSYYHIGKTNKYLERGISIVLGAKHAEKFRQSFDQPLRSETDKAFKERLKKQSIYQPKIVQARQSMEDQSYGRPSHARTISI